MLSLLISEHSPHLEFVVPFIAAVEQRFHVLIAHMVAAERAMGPADVALDVGGGGRGGMNLFATALSPFKWAFLTWAVLVLVLSVIWAVCQLSKWWRFWALASTIPGPPAELWRGNLRDLQAAGGWVHYTAFIRGLHKEYGPVVRFWKGRQLVVSVHEPAHVKQVFAQATSNPHGGKRSAPFLPAASIFWGDLREVKARRSWLAQHLRTSFLERVHPVSLASVAKVVERWGASQGEDIDLKACCSSLALEIIGSVAFGEDTWALPICREFERLFVSTPRESAVFASHVVDPWWDARYRALRRDCRRLTEIAEELLQTKEAALRAPAIGTGAPDLSSDFLGSLLSAKDRTSGELLYTREQAKAQVVGTMFAGNHTTGTSLMWILLRLAQYPAVQAKVYAEIAHCCTSSPPSEADVRRLQYLPAVIHESLRLAPVNVTKSRVSSARDLVVGGHVIPRGTAIAAPVESLNRDPAAWGCDADEFRPERFLRKSAPEPRLFETNSAQVTGSSGGCPFSSMACAQVADCPVMGSSGGDPSADASFIDPGSSPSFMTFGRGARACLGRAFSIVEQKVVIATLVQRFELRLARSQADGRFSHALDNLLIQPSPSPLLRVSIRNGH